MAAFGGAHCAYQNMLDGRLFFTCGGHQSISRFHSIHDNHANDRLFELACSNVSTSRSLPEKCNWTARKCHAIKYEPPRGKTNNVVSEQVRHKSTSTVAETS